VPNGSLLRDVVEFIVDCEHKTAPAALPDSYFAYSVGTRNLKAGRIDLGSAKQVDAATYEAWTRRGQPQCGDLILAREAPVGQVGYVDGRARLCLGQRTVLIRPDPSRADPRFLHYLLLSPPVQQWMQDRAAGSTVPHLNVADVRLLELGTLPALPEQWAIREVLSALDDKIESNGRLVNAAQKLAGAVWSATTNRPRSASVATKTTIGDLADEGALYFSDGYREQLSNVVDAGRREGGQAATFSSVVVAWSSVTRMPSLKVAPASTSATSSWPLNRRQRSWAASSSL